MGNFENWATLISTNPSFLHRNFTLFIPAATAKTTTISSYKTNAFSYHHQTFISYNQDFILYDTLNISSFFINKTQELESYWRLHYLIVPHLFSFADLVRHHPVHTRLPTLLPGNTLLITANNNNSASCRFSIDGSCVTLPDLYQDDAVFAHRVAAALDYTTYGDENGTNSTTSSTPVVKEKWLWWGELWREMWDFPAFWGVHWLFIFNPWQLVIDAGENTEALIRYMRELIEALREWRRLVEEMEWQRAEEEAEERRMAELMAEQERLDREWEELEAEFERVKREMEEQDAEIEKWRQEQAELERVRQEDDYEFEFLRRERAKQKADRKALNDYHRQKQKEMKEKRKKEDDLLQKRLQYDSDYVDDDDDEEEEEEETSSSS